MELLIAYVVLGALAALAQGDWRVRQLARNTLLWPALVPRMLRQDPAPPDPPQLVAWEARINASLASLKSAVEGGRLLGDPAVGQKLLVDTQADLVGIARRHAELDAVLQAPENDLRAARGAAEGAEPHRLPALRRRVAHIEKLYAAREALETRLEAGMAEAMNLAARLHLARATDAPVESLDARLASLSRVVDGVEEIELIGGVPLEESLPEGWAPQLEDAIDAEELPPTPTRTPATPAEKLSFEEAFVDDPVQLPAARPRAAAPEPAADEGSLRARMRETRASRLTLVGAVLALALGSIFYRVLVFGALEQTAALFIGMPALLAAVVALLPPARSYTGMMLKVMTLMLLLSGVLLAEGFICIIMAAPLFYLVGIIAGVLLDAFEPKKPAARVMLVAPLLLLSVEGVSDGLSAPRAEAVTVSRTVAASPDEVAAALSEQPAFPGRLPFYLRMGFPQPTRSLGAGLAEGDRRLIHFAGGEGKPGDLLLEVWSSVPGRVVFGAISDTSHIAHWLTWRSAEVSWSEVAPGQTAVTWTLRYDRELDPVVWFAPTERYAVRLAVEYLLDNLLPPEVSDDVAS